MYTQLCYVFNQMNELEAVISELRQEKAMLQSQFRYSHNNLQSLVSCVLLYASRSTEKECFKLRKDAAQMQIKLMELTHKIKLQKLQMLSKATMTDEGSSCHCDSISVTDSATQVNHSQLRSEVRDAQVSPIRPWGTQSSSNQEKATQTFISGAEKILRSHRRTHSEGDSLFYKKKAKEAFSRVKKISKQLQYISFPSGIIDSSPEDSLATQSKVEKGKVEIVEQSTGCTSKAEPLPSGQEITSHSHIPEPHKCASQQQAKLLQKKLRALSRQVYMISIYNNIV